MFFLLGYLPFGIPLIMLLLFVFGTGYGNVFSASILLAGTPGFISAVKSQFTFTVFIAASCILTSLFSIMRIIRRFDKNGSAKSQLKREKERTAVENIIIFFFAMFLSLISAAIESNVFQYCIINSKF
jgi:Na+/H+-translocating membrane pyrophosphatase